MDLDKIAKETVNVIANLKPLSLPLILNGFKERQHRSHVVLYRGLSTQHLQ